MKATAFLVLMVILTACTNTKITTKNTTTTWWVNSYKVACTGVAPMNCLQIQKNESIEQGKWLNFYTQIEGFVFEPGYLQKIRVTEEKLNPAQVAADGSSIKYTLVAVLEKKTDEHFAIHDIWMLEAIDGVLIPKSPDNETMERPVLEINVTEMRVMGSDGCNRITGGIAVLDGEKLEFGNMSATRMMCNNMEIPDKFNKTLPTVRKFKKEGLKLNLLNECGKEVLRLKKVD